MTVTLNLNEATDYTLTIKDVLADILSKANGRTLWVYDSATDMIWWYDCSDRKWTGKPMCDRSFYMTHLFHFGTLYEFEGTNTTTKNYLGKI